MVRISEADDQPTDLRVEKMAGLQKKRTVQLNPGFELLGHQRTDNTGCLQSSIKLNVQV